MCNTLEVFGLNVYAGFFASSNGAGLGLWRADPTVLPIVWTEVLDPGVNDVEIIMIRAVGARLFVSTRSGNVNALFSSPDGAAFTGVIWDLVNPPATDVPITDVAQDSSGSNYWVTVGPLLYMDTAGDLSSFDRYAGYTGQPAGRPGAGTKTFGGLFETSGTLYVSAGNGLLFSTANGGGIWAATPVAIEVSDDPVPFTAFAAPTIDTGAVYVGTQGYGYYRIPGGVVTGTPVRSPAYNISALYNGAINCLLYDAGQSRLFLGTAGSGLWRGDHVSGSEWLWKQE
jgi:hypothetical protein